MTANTKIAALFIAAGSAALLGYIVADNIPQTTRVKPDSITPADAHTRYASQEVFLVETTDQSNKTQTFSIARNDWQNYDRIRDAIDKGCDLEIAHTRFESVIRDYPRRITGAIQKNCP